MLVAVKNIGRFLEENNRKIDETAQGKILVINFKTQSSSFEISIEDFNHDKINKYLFRKGESKANQNAPFVPLTDPKKSFNKVSKWISKAFNNVPGKDKSQIEIVYQLLKTRTNEILSELQNKIEEYNRKQIGFLTFKIDNFYPGDFEFLRNLHRQIAEQKTNKSSSTNKTCSICGEIKEKVSARTSVYQFDTDDKLGFISGFDKKYFWKNFPVCQDCRRHLEIGRKFIDTKLKFKFVGSLKYQIIPDCLFEDFSLLKDIIQILKETTKDISLKKRVINRITEDENDILYRLSNLSNTLALNLLFMESSNSAERILLNVEEVLPSRLKEIFQAKEKVDSLFNNVKENEKFTFGKIRIFFSSSNPEKKDYDLDRYFLRYFLEIVDAVFKDRNLDFSFLTKFFMNIISKKFIDISENEQSREFEFENAVKDAMMCVAFFENLKLINFKEEEMEGSIFDPVFKKYGKSLNSPEKRGIFLLGALTQILLQVQNKSRRSKPFKKKLKNLKMNENDIKSLLPQINNKFEEYDSFDKGKRLISQEISNYLLTAGDNWKLSVDEINYYFACGMSLSPEIQSIVYSREKQEVVNE